MEAENLSQIYYKDEIIPLMVAPIASSNHLQTNLVVIESKFSTTQVLERFVTVRDQDNLERSQR